MGSLSSEGSAGPVVRPIESADRLAGPDPLLPPADPGRPSAVTGGGLLARVDPVAGVTTVRRDGRAVMGTILLAHDSPGDPGRPLAASPDATSFRAGGGRWERTLPLPGGGAVLERGLLPEDPAALVVQWSLLDGGRETPAGGAISLLARAHDPDGRPGPEASFRLTPGEVATFAFLPIGEDEARAAQLLRSPAARETLRSLRLPGEDLLRIRCDGAPDRELFGSLVRISDVFPEDALELGPKSLVRLGCAGLRGGLRAPALLAMQQLAGAERPGGGGDPAGFLRLVADWLAWTGDLGGIARLREAIERAAREVGVALPRDLGTLGDLLPPAAPTPPPGDPPTDPRAHPDLDARPVERVDGALGIAPEARYGRLRLAPDLAGEWHTLEVEGIGCGDTRVSLAVRKEPGTIEVHLRQDRGRVPVQLVFEPLVEGDRIGEVRIGGAPAQVGRSVEEGTDGGAGTRLRCQFPLDPERTVRIAVG